MRIDNSALRPLRGFIAEAAVAAAIERISGAEAHHHGGSRKAVDVTAVAGDRKYKVDAKALVALSASERRRWPGCTFQFARDLHKPFDEDVVTDIGLVDIGSCLPSPSLEGTVLDLGRVDLDLARVSLVRVSIMNENMDPESAAEHGWRYVIVEDALLDEYRI